MRVSHDPFLLREGRSDCQSRGDGFPLPAIQPRSLLQAGEVEGRYRLEETLELQLADGFGDDQVLDRSQDPLRYQDLPGTGLAAQPRREVGHRADRPIVPAPLEADGADGRVTLRDPGPEREIEPVLPPLRGQRVQALAH